MFRFGQEFDHRSCILELSRELRTLAEVIRNKPNSSAAFHPVKEIAGVLGRDRRGPIPGTRKALSFGRKDRNALFDAIQAPLDGGSITRRQVELLACCFFRGRGTGSRRLRLLLGELALHTDRKS
jgi:hypothetical protein